MDHTTIISIEKCAHRRASERRERHEEGGGHSERAWIKQYSPFFHFHCADPPGRGRVDGGGEEGHLPEEGGGRGVDGDQRDIQVIERDFFQEI